MTQPLDRNPGRESQYVWRVSRRALFRQRPMMYASHSAASPVRRISSPNCGKAGVRLAGTREFRDHHAYTAADVRLLLRLRQQAGATAFVTTEKDAVNLGDYLLELASASCRARHAWSSIMLRRRRRRGTCRIARRGAVQLPPAPEREPRERMKSFTRSGT